MGHILTFCLICAVVVLCSGIDDSNEEHKEERSIRNKKRFVIHEVTNSPQSTGSLQTKCYSCGTFSPESGITDKCHTVKVCQSNEMCRSTVYIESGKEYFIFGCFNKHVCQILGRNAIKMYALSNHLQPTIPPTSRRGHQCDMCCGDDICNNAHCTNVTARLYRQWTSGQLDLNTLSTHSTGNGGHSLPPSASLTTTTGKPTTIDPSGKCYSCAGITDPNTCKTLQTCESQEMCISTVFIHNGTPLYTFGCHRAVTCIVNTKWALRNYASSRHLQPIPSIQRSITSGIRVCDMCCADGLCNNVDCYNLTARLYKQWASGHLDLNTLSTSSNGKGGHFLPPSASITTTTGKSTTVFNPAGKCYSCEGITDPNTCKTLQTCQSNEMCISTVFIQSGIPLYTFGCYRTATCIVNTKWALRSYASSRHLQRIPSIRRSTSSGIRVCDMCCGDDLCNNVDCYNLTARMYTQWANGILDLSTLTTMASGRR